VFTTFLHAYIYIIYTPNLGFEIAVPGREREQGRSRGSTKGARGRSEGVGGRAAREQRGSMREHYGAVQGAAGGSLKWLPPPRFELPSLLFCRLDCATFHRIYLATEAIRRKTSSSGMILPVPPCQGNPGRAQPSGATTTLDSLTHNFWRCRSILSYSNCFPEHIAPL